MHIKFKIAHELVQLKKKKKNKAALKDDSRFLLFRNF